MVRQCRRQPEVHPDRRRYRPARRKYDAAGGLQRVRNQDGGFARASHRIGTTTMANESTFSKTRTLRRSLFRARSLRRDRRGVAAVEFAIIVPVLIGMFMGVVDLGLGLFTQVQLA